MEEGSFMMRLPRARSSLSQWRVYWDCHTFIHLCN